MSSYYVDLSQVGTGDGSSGTPFNATQFFARSVVDGDIFNLKGSYHSTGALFRPAPPTGSCTYQPWDLTRFGAWRIASDSSLKIDTDLPTLPTLSSDDWSNSSIRIVMTPGTSIGAQSINLYYKQGTTVDKETGTKIEGITNPKVVNGLSQSTQYAFAVSRVDADYGESALSSTLIQSTGGEA